MLESTKLYSAHFTDDYLALNFKPNLISCSSSRQPDSVQRGLVINYMYYNLLSTCLTSY